MLPRASLCSQSITAAQQRHSSARNNTTNVILSVVTLFDGFKHDGFIDFFPPLSHSMKRAVQMNQIKEWQVKPSLAALPSIQQDTFK